MKLSGLVRGKMNHISDKGKNYGVSNASDPWRNCGTSRHSQTRDIKSGVYIDLLCYKMVTIFCRLLVLVLL